MAVRLLLALFTLLLFPTPARAEANEDADRAPRAWDDRSGWNTEIAVGSGIGLVGGRDESGGQRTGLAADTTIRVGFHRVGAFHGKSLLGLRASELACCMPLAMCGGPIGLFLGPESGLVGNEVGIDVAAHVLHGVSGNSVQLGYAVGVRPSLRVARDSRFRTGTLIGSLLPEIGLAFPGGRSHEAYFELSLYPISMTLTRDVAIHWEVLRERLGVPLDGTPVSITIGSSLAVMLL